MLMKELMLQASRSGVMLTSFLRDILLAQAPFITAASDVESHSRLNTTNIRRPVAESIALAPYLSLSLLELQYMICQLPNDMR